MKHSYAKPISSTPAAPATPGNERQRLLQDVYGRYWMELCRYMRRNFGIGPPEPEDVAQSVFARFAALERPEDVRNPRAFLYSAARNLITDYHRRARTSASFARDMASTERDSVYDLDPERVLLSNERMQMLVQALHQLPPVQQRVIVLSRLHGLGYGEIGAKLAMSPGAVRKHVERGLANCLRLLNVAEASTRGAADGDGPEG